MSIFRILADLMCDYATIREKEEREAEIARLKELAKEQEEKFRKKQAEHERWLAATEAYYKDPDEWKVLPYGWSPFGLYL